MILAESHCHLDLYPPERRQDMLEQARVNNVGLMLTVGMNLESSAQAIHLAQSLPGVWAGIGIHPWEAVPPTDEVRRRLAQLARGEKVVAIGEIGLDYFRGPETRETQKELLRYELSLALETGLPVSIHCRDAHREMMDIIHGEIGSGLKGALHEGADDWATVKDWLDLDFYIAVSVRGFVTNEIPALLAALRQVPLDRLLIETDAAGDEYVVEVKDIVPVIEKLASLRETTVDEMADITTSNLKRLLDV
jgi:TatD DNase family protein